MFITRFLENGRQHSRTKSQKRTSLSKKTNRTSNRPPSKLNDEHKAHLTDSFDENPSAIIQDAVQNLIKSFEDSQTKESRVVEFMKEGCNLSIKVITRHPAARNKISTLEVRVKFVEEWMQRKGMLYMQNCAFLDESGFDINMRRSRVWSKSSTQVIIESPSARAVSHTIIGAVLAFGVMNASIRDSGNVKKRRVVGATKRKASGDAAFTTPKGTTAGQMNLKRLTKLTSPF